MSPALSFVAILAVLAGFGGLAGCATTGPFVWGDDVTPAQLGGDYVIGAGDVLSMRVLGQEALATEGRVRTDGKLTVPFLGDIDAAGKRPSDLKRELEAGLKPFLVQPTVILTVREARPLTVAVLGEVSRSGMVTLEPGAGLAQTLALAGGPNEFADRDKIFVIRKTPHVTRIRFTYEAITRGLGRAPSFAMLPGDVVVIE